MINQSIKPSKEVCESLGVKPEDIEAFESSTCRDCMFNSKKCKSGSMKCYNRADWKHISWKYARRIMDPDMICLGVKKGVVECLNCEGEWKWATNHNLYSIKDNVDGGLVYRWTKEFDDKVKEISEGVKKGIVEYKYKNDDDFTPAVFYEENIIQQNVLRGGEYRFINLTDPVEIERGIKAGVVEVFGALEMWTDAIMPYGGTIKECLEAGFIYKVKHGCKMPEKFQPGMELTDPNEIMEARKAGRAQYSFNGGQWLYCTDTPYFTVTDAKLNMQHGYRYRIAPEPKSALEKFLENEKAKRDVAKENYVVSWDLASKCDRSYFTIRKLRDRNKEELDLLVGAYKFRDVGGGTSHLFINSNFLRDQSKTEIAKVGTNAWEPMQVWETVK